MSFSTVGRLGVFLMLSTQVLHELYVRNKTSERNALRRKIQVLQTSKAEAMLLTDQKPHLLKIVEELYGPEGKITMRHRGNELSLQTAINEEKQLSEKIDHLASYSLLRRPKKSGPDE